MQKIIPYVKKNDLHHLNSYLNHDDAHILIAIVKLYKYLCNMLIYAQNLMDVLKRFLLRYLF